MKLTTSFARPSHRENWFLWGWWIPSVRYGFRIIGIEVNYECVSETELKAKLFDRLLYAVKLERNERVKFDTGWETDPAKLDAASIEIVSIINEAGRKE